MAAPTKLNILLTDASTVTINISQGVQDLENKGGVGAADQAIRTIFKAGGFWDTPHATFYSFNQIKNITAS